MHVVRASGVSTDRASPPTTSRSRSHSYFPTGYVEIAVRRETDIPQLQDEHLELQRAHTDSLHLAGDPQRQILPTAAASVLFARYCQDRHNRLFGVFQNQSTQLAECSAVVLRLEE